MNDDDDDNLNRRQRSFFKRLRRTWTKQEIIRCNDFLFEQKVLHPPSNKSWTPSTRAVAMASCSLVSQTNHQVIDSKDIKLIQYLPKFIKSDDYDDLLAAITAIQTTIPPFTPPVKWKRFHQSTLPNYKSSSISTNRGYYYYGVHHETGHYTEPPIISSHWGNISCRSTEAGETFRSSTAFTKLSEQLSLAFHALDPAKWRSYRHAYDIVVETKVKVRALDKCKIQAFLGVFILVDLFTHPHYDLKDPPDGWTAMVVLGDFEGGELYLPDVRIAFPHQSRDVIFIRARLLEHFIGEYQGTRYVLVFATSDTIFKWLQRVFSS